MTMMRMAAVCNAAQVIAAKSVTIPSTAKKVFDNDFFNIPG
jgi:hypothetical protein